MDEYTLNEVASSVPREYHESKSVEGSAKVDDKSSGQEVNVPLEYTVAMSADGDLDAQDSKAPSLTELPRKNENVDELLKERSFSHISDFQSPKDDNNPLSCDYPFGPPTFGDSRSRSPEPAEEPLPSGAFNGLSNNYMVFRNIGMDSQNATFSFGYEEPQPETKAHPDAIEAINYYVPDPQRVRQQGIRSSPFYGNPKTGYASIMSNIGGDTTTSTPTRYSDNEDNKGFSSDYSGDDYNSPIASSTGGRRAPLRMGRMPRNPRRRKPHAGESSPCSDADSNDDASFTATEEGLFEVPLNICSMSRIIDPFKGFTKVHTNRSIRLLHFVRTGTKTVCNLESNACKLLQTRIKDHKVVAISMCGDNRSGKSYLASLLVNQPVKSFRCSEAYSLGDSMQQVQGISEGTVWAYVGIYEEKFAYIYLDFDGFENNQQERINMISFALLLSNCVICNISNPPRSGIYDAVRAMINITKPEDKPLNPDMRSLDLDETVEDFQTKTSFYLNKQVTASKYFGSKSFGSKSFGSKCFGSKDFDLLAEEESEVASQVEETDIWKAPIMNFVFRDCDGHVRCIDERVYTPETLVEQGIFDHYTNILNCNRRDRSIDFKNDMLDAFEVFSHRKYTSLPCPVASTNPSNPQNRMTANNAKGALKRIFATLLAPSNGDIMTTDLGDSSSLRFLGSHTQGNQPNLMGIPTNMLNPQFCERLDEIKACVYQDTLAHSQCDIQLNGRMFMNYLQLLIAQFNMCGRVRLKDAKAILRDVHVKENDSIAKDMVVQFLKGLKNHVVIRLPVEPRELLSKCMRMKQKSLHCFQTRAFGCSSQYREQYNQLEKSLDNIMEKLEEKNDKIAVDTATAMFEKCSKSLEGKMAEEGYTYEELLVDIAKMRKLFLQKFKGHSQVTEKVFPQLSQRLYKTYDEHHPKTPTPDFSEITERYANK